MFSKTLKISMLSAAITTLAACGGGGGGSDSAAPAYKGNTVNGVAVDFYLKDALIRFSNPNCAPIRTNAQGQFSFTTTATCQSSEMLISGGIDIGTGLPFTGRLQLKNTNFNQATQLAVTPLTTLEKHLVDADQQALLPTILQNLGINDVAADLSSFNPVTDANAQTAAAVFALQQLVNKIEDNLESLQTNGTSAFSADQAAQIAFLAVIDIVKEQPLFKDGAVNFDENTLDAVLIEAFSVAENQLQAQDPDATIPASLISDIAADSVKLSTLLDTLVQQGGDGQQLLLELQKPENQAVLEETLQPPTEIITQPIYGDFSLANYSVMDLKNSSQVQPIELDLKDIDTVLEFNFGIQNTQKALQDNFKLGFSIQAQTNNRTETLDVILDEVQVTFDKTGRIATASINKGTLLTVASSLNFPIPGTSASTSYASFELPRAFSVSNNRTISLSQLLNSDQRLKSAYDTYKASLVSGNSLRAKIFVAPTNYQIDGNLGLDVSSMSIRDIKFSAPSVAAYLKLK
ncbi:hypothetical protein [Acinetobacter sp.]|uniref:hypothetical protein n=1 Tax=Acinetobacter sp. TaxID=472 RepID=UPI00388EECE3